MNKNSPRTKTQPPGWVFGVVWPVLYLLIGWNWSITRENNILNWLHILLLIVLNLWVYLAGCRDDYKMGALLFIIIVALSFATWMMSSLHSLKYKNTWFVPLLLVPYLAWILFAHQLNVHIVENDYQR
jgi:tryptophan-rich sensory protein